MDVKTRQRIQLAVDAARWGDMSAIERKDMIDDLHCLTAEIQLTLGMYWEWFTIYSRLLSQEPYLWDPAKIYRIGRYCANKKMSYRDGFWFCMKFLDKRLETREYYQELQCYFNRIATVLRCVHASSLIAEYTEAYRKVYGGIHRNIDVFFRIGYESVK